MHHSIKVMLLFPEQQGLPRENTGCWGMVLCTSELCWPCLSKHGWPAALTMFVPPCVFLAVFTFFSWTSLGDQCSLPAQALAELMWRWHICLSSLWTLGLSWVIAASQLTLNMKNRFLQGIWGSEFFSSLIYFYLNKLRELHLFQWQEMLKDLSEIICSDLQGPGIYARFLLSTLHQLWETSVPYSECIFPAELVLIKSSLSLWLENPVQWSVFFTLKSSWPLVNGEVKKQHVSSRLTYPVHPEASLMIIIWQCSPELKIWKWQVF